jgi:aminocarboxymuconate-semialdehyde decarboxylase
MDKIDLFKHFMPKEFFDKLHHIIPAIWCSMPLPACRRCGIWTNACGIQIFTNVQGKPLSLPEYHQLFEIAAAHDLPVWVHPMRMPDHADYASEDKSEDEIWFTFGWPYETTACMTRLIYSGLFDTLPELKIITHHMGGMIPFFANKISLGFAQLFDGDSGHNPMAAHAGLKHQPLHYFHMLYGDTALNGSAAATACGHDFFTTGHSLFATDAPFDCNGGRDLIQGTLDALDALPVTAEERAAIYSDNTRRLLNLA